MSTLSEKIDFHVKKAEKALETAIANHEREDYDSVANRGYYCVLYCEKALLFSKDIAGESHRHIHNKRVFEQLEGVANLFLYGIQKMPF